ncbi:MAG TPA: aldo/keto reductase [Clostridia bacterium]|nr:aldo/keto reductase [Clostridia bacterium]
MKYKVLGSTGLEVSVVGFGGIPIQRTSAEEAKKVILKAEELGINFIDTARAYTVSEEYIGQALAGRRDKWIFASKSMARRKEAMARDVDTSLKNLQTDYIDLYQIHNVATERDWNRVMGEEGAYAALLEAKEAGKIGHIGFTTHSKEILKLALESGKFETVMFPYNIVESQGEDLFKRAKELNIGVIAMKPMAGGAIEDGTLALKYILQNEAVTTAIPGMADVKEVEENVKAANEFSPLMEGEKQKIEEIAKSLGNSFCRRCGYCGPCPQGIDIPSMFLFSAYKERYDLADWSEDRYYAMKARAKDCIECGACEERCPYHLPIREMLKEVRRVFNE